MDWTHLCDMNQRLTKVHEVVHQLQTQNMAVHTAACVGASVETDESRVYRFR